GTIGREADLLHPGPESCRQIMLPQPVLDNDTLAKLVRIDDNDELPDFSSAHIHGLYPVAEGGEGLRRALDEVRTKVSAAIADGVSIIVLSDRESDEKLAPIPSLLLTAAVHHHLVRE
ncbi:hypothetical protein G3I15_40635, partial [Streptomyces sp. SID10244]|nr:hypothetical protein [Streptomyces sp. SID10244]